LNPGTRDRTRFNNAIDNAINNEDGPVPTSPAGSRGASLFNDESGAPTRMPTTSEVYR
jgi:hypothetical protein